MVGRDRPDDWLLPEVQFLNDVLPGQGPLGGLVTALEYARSPVLALACDMPLLTANCLTWLMNQAIGKDGAAVKNGDQIEPLFSLYTCSILPLAQQNLSSRKRSLHQLIHSGQFHIVNAPPAIAQHLVNVNTMEEFNRIYKQ